jgi:hypothetical protein
MESFPLRTVPLNTKQSDIQSNIKEASMTQSNATVIGEPEDKPVGTVGRGDDQGGEGTHTAGEAVSSHRSPRKAGVVIRATIEHVGLVGDTELTVNVKWPASTFCVQPDGKPAAPASQAQDSQQVPGNGPLASNFNTLYGEATADPKPAVGTTSGTYGSTEK